MISGRNVIYLGSSRYRRLIITDLSPLRIGLCRNLCPRLQLPLRQHVFCLAAGFFFYPTIFFLHRQEELCCPPSLCRFETPAASFQKCRTGRALVRRRKRLPAAVTVGNNIKNPPPHSVCCAGAGLICRDTSASRRAFTSRSAPGCNAGAWWPLPRGWQ